jgi:hypothetical protein
MRLRSAVALVLLVLPMIPAQAGAAPTRQPPRHRSVTASELLSADELNGMVLAILGGQPQPVLSGSDARRREMQAAWERLRGLMVEARSS